VAGNACRFVDDQEVIVLKKNFGKVFEDRNRFLAVGAA
jgi:hypothetical protein